MPGVRDPRPLTERTTKELVVELIVGTLFAFGVIAYFVWTAFLPSILFAAALFGSLWVFGAVKYTRELLRRRA